MTNAIRAVIGGASDSLPCQYEAVEEKPPLFARPQWETPRFHVADFGFIFPHDDHSVPSRGALIDGGKVRSLRKKMALTQDDLATKSDVSKRTIENIERVDSRVVSFATCKGLAAALDVSVDDLRVGKTVAISRAS